MELLINACMKAGADRSRLEAKMFGGGHVLRIQMSGGSVSERNVAFAHEFLAMEGIPLVKEDVGGVQAREIYYFTDNGRTLLKRVAPSAMRNVEELARSERAQLETLSRPLPPDEDSNVTLF